MSHRNRILVDGQQSFIDGNIVAVDFHRSQINEIVIRGMITGVGYYSVRKASGVDKERSVNKRFGEVNIGNSVVGPTGCLEEEGKQSVKHSGEENALLNWAGRERLDRPNAAKPVTFLGRPLRRVESEHENV